MLHGADRHPTSHTSVNDYRIQASARSNILKIERFGKCAACMQCRTVEQPIEAILIARGTNSESETLRTEMTHRTRPFKTPDET